VSIYLFIFSHFEKGEGAHFVTGEFDSGSNYFPGMTFISHVIKHMKISWWKLIR